MSEAEAEIVIVDDTPANIDVLIDVLGNASYRIRVATSGERGLELALRQPPDLILLDVMMPGLDGYETCRRLRAHPLTAEVPVIFVTARADEVALGFAAGGVDYITKPIQADEVRARVRHQIERRSLLRALQDLNRQLEDKVRERTAELTLTNRQLRQEINERRYMQDRLNYLAAHDFVTRLYNRNALDAHVSEVLARLQRERAIAHCLQVDIEQFRIVNETCGYIAGDELLRQFADCLNGQIERGDFVARVGGDKFVVISENPDTAHGERLALRLQQQVALLEFDWEGRRFPVAASIAVVPMSDAVLSFDQLMLMADETAYLARRGGRATIRVYGQGAENSSADGRGSTHWTRVLLDALSEGHLRVYFQRLQPLALSEVPGLRVEALMRLQDPITQQILLPDSFIRAAEHLHLVMQLDRWMVSQVIQFLATHRNLHAQVDQITVNISAVSLRDPALADDIIAQLEQHAVPPPKLCFEITETEAIVNLPLARSFMRKLRDRGCRFSLDDFGSGYASYGSLRELQFDHLKIDGMFVRDMHQNEADAVMVRSMVDMASQLGKPVVAEFVENAEIAERLRRLGVAWAQGFHYHRPERMSAEAIALQAQEALRVWSAARIAPAES
jgi:diguanylate cyclase (GGDEF)-like protein